MALYLIFYLVFNKTFENLTIRASTNQGFEPMCLWYFLLWRHKVQFRFNEIQHSFVKVRQMITRRET
jgi:hypothetical protein